MDDCSAFGDEYPVDLPPGGPDDGAMQSILDGVRYLYRKNRHTGNPLAILCIFRDMSDDELVSMAETAGATVKMSTLSNDGRVTVDIREPDRLVIDFDAATGISVPDEDRRRPRDIVAEYLLRACYDHVVRQHSGTDHGSGHLKFILGRIGGCWMGERMVARMQLRNDSDIVQTGLLLRALDIIDRKVDDDRVLYAYVDLKGKPRRTRELERKTRFNDVFFDVEFDPMVTENDERGMWLCFQDLLSEDLLPDIMFLKEVCLKVRRIPDLGGQYASVSKLLIVRDYGSFVHEYAHALDHHMGRLSGKKEFAPILALYRHEFDRLVKDLQSRPDSRYYKDPMECFARCFEMHVMRRHGACKLLRPYWPEWAYPGDPKLAEMVDSYFDGLCRGNL